MSSSRIVLDKSFFDNVNTTIRAVEASLVNNKKDSKYNSAVNLAKLNLKSLEMHQHLPTQSAKELNNAAFALTQLHQAVDTSDKVAKTMKPTHCTKLKDQIEKLNAYSAQAVEDKNRVEMDELLNKQRKHAEELETVNKDKKALELNLKNSDAELKKVRKDAENLDQKVKTLEANLAKEVETTKNLREQVASDNKNYQSAMETLKAQLASNEAAANEKLDRLTAEKSTLTSAHLAEMNGLKTAQNDEVTTLTAAHNAQVNLLTTQLAEQKSYFDNEAERLKSLHKSEVANLTQQLNDAAGHEVLVSELNKSHAAELNTARAQVENFKSSITSLKNFHAKQLDTLQEQVNKLNKANQDLIANPVVEKTETTVITETREVDSANNQKPSFLYSLFGKKHHEEPTADNQLQEVSDETVKATVSVEMQATDVLVDSPRP